MSSIQNFVRAGDVAKLKRRVAELEARLKSKPPQPDESMTLRRRCQYLEAQVIALSRAPIKLAERIKELELEVSALRVGAKRRFTEKQLRARGDWNTEERANAQVEPRESIDDVLADVEEAS